MINIILNEIDSHTSLQSLEAESQEPITALIEEIKAMIEKLVKSYHCLHQKYLQEIL